jgi:hypothetical protein
MMTLREHNWVRFEQEVETAIQKLKVYQWTCQWKVRVTAYALVNDNCDEHRFKEQDLEGHGEDVMEPMSDVEFIRFLGCIISTISCLLPQPLCLSGKQDWHIGFGNSKKYHD